MQTREDQMDEMLDDFIEVMNQKINQMYDESLDEDTNMLRFLPVLNRKINEIRKKIQEYRRLLGIYIQKYEDTESYYLEDEISNLEFQIELLDRQLIVLLDLRHESMTIPQA